MGIFNLPFNMSWVEAVKGEHPGLVSSNNFVLCDAPGGTQVHQSVIDAITRRLSSPTANLGGSFPSAKDTIQAVAEARETVALFFNCLPQEVIFGPNMTSLTMNMARSIGEKLLSTDNVVVTRLDHDANHTPWVKVALKAGAKITILDFIQPECYLDLDQLEQVVNENTKLVAVGAASNLVGTLTPIKKVVEIIKQKSRGNALVFIDAVHYAPHKPIDVEDFGCDFLVCSTYKFSGPHAAIMFGKKKLLEELKPFKLTASTELLPSSLNCQSNKWENGTQSFEIIAGIKASIEYLASLSSKSGLEKAGSSFRQRILTGYEAIYDHEIVVIQLFLKEIAYIP